MPQELFGDFKVLGEFSVGEMEHDIPHRATADVNQAYVKPLSIPHDWKSSRVMSSSA
jgi:hypothetical protein